MASVRDSGDGLYQQLQNLNLVTGNLTAKEFSTWFDSDDKDTVEFLSWFTTCIGSENVITAQENKCYERISEDLVLSEDKYNELIVEVEKECPGIFEVKSNELEILCMEEELEMWKEELKCLEKQMISNEKVNTILQNKINKIQCREAVAKLRIEEAERKCLDKTNALKSVKAELQNQMKNYENKLTNLCGEMTSSFLSNMDMEDHNEYVKNVGDILIRSTEKTSSHRILGSNVKQSMVCRKTFASSTKCLEYLSPIPSVQKSKNFCNVNCTIKESTFDEKVDVMQSRLEKAYLNNINAKVQRDELNSIYDYLKSIDSSTSYERGDNFDSMINAREEEMFTYKADIQKMVVQIVKQQIEEQKYPTLQIEIDTCTRKLDFMKQISENMDEVLSYIFLLYMLLDQERKDIKSMESFFREVYQYITYNQQNERDRTQAMLDIIKQQQEEPFMNKFQLISLIVSAITGKDTVMKDLSEAVKIVKAFTSEYKITENKVFCNDFLKFKIDARKILQNINTLKKHLTNGPTSEYTIIPYRVHTLFAEIKEVHSHEEHLLKSYLQLSQSIEGKLNKNKWLRYRRWLWMYFLESPKHVYTFIQEIRKEIEKAVQNNLE